MAIALSHVLKEHVWITNIYMFNILKHSLEMESLKAFILKILTIYQPPSKPRLHTESVTFTYKHKLIICNPFVLKIDTFWHSLFRDLVPHAVFRACQPLNLAPFVQSTHIFTARVTLPVYFFFLVCFPDPWKTMKIQSIPTFGTRSSSWERPRSGKVQSSRSSCTGPFRRNTNARWKKCTTGTFRLVAWI